MHRKTVYGCGVAVGQMRRKLAGLVATSALLSLYSLAPKAVAIGIYTLGQGGSIPASPSSYPMGGTVLDSVTNSFTSSTIDGTVIASVISGDTSNPYGGLTFTYSLSLSSFSGDFSSEMTVGSYDGVATDVSYNLTDSEAVPSNFTRSPTQNGSVLRFLWSTDGGIAPGHTGALIVVQTDASDFTTTASGGVIDSQTVAISTLAPIPEPGIACMLVSGFGVFAFRRWKSKK